MRLDKLLSHMGFGTRKEVKQLIKKQAVTVDNTPVKKSDIRVNPSEQTIMVYDNLVQYKPYVYLMLHKPGGYVSATMDNRDQTVIDLIPESFSHYSLFPVGRLDKDTEGLLLITNDGKAAHQLTSPKKDIFKTYYAEIDGYIEDTAITDFKKGVILDDGYLTKPALLNILEAGPISKIELSISEGKFHQVKRMFEAIGLTVIYLKRIKMGNLLLDPDLAIGESRELNEKELAYITTLK